jgi:hypothetical protein
MATMIPTQIVSDLLSAGVPRWYVPDTLLEEGFARVGISEVADVEPPDPGPFEFLSVLRP